MVKLDKTIYVKPLDQDDEVLIFGKSPEQDERDHKDGVARLGGMWRTPSYTKAYLRAARLLLKEAREGRDLDQLALPIFYLHRHSLELFIKGLLGLLYDIADMQHRLYKTPEIEAQLPNKAALKRLDSEHDLVRLYNDLDTASKKLGFNLPPKSIEEAVRLIGRYEIDPTWSRYPKPRGENSKAYLVNEVVIPSVEMNEALERAVREAGFDMDTFPQTYEAELYHAWNSLMMTLDHRDG